jgi:hypothetical protein
MAKIYFEAVKEGKRTLESVPKRWRTAVAAMLEASKKDTDQEE